MSAVTGPPSEFLRRGTTVSAAPTGLWARARGPAPSPAADSAAPEPDSPPSADPRPPARGPRAGEDFRDDDDDEESAELDPLDPADPVVSANATGSEPRPEPTPKATANAPTRPTYRANPDNPDAPTPTPTERRPYSMLRTPVVPRRPAACLGSFNLDKVTPRENGTITIGKPNDCVAKTDQMPANLRKTKRYGRFNRSDGRSDPKTTQEHPINGHKKVISPGLHPPSRHERTRPR